MVHCDFIDHHEGYAQFMPRYGTVSLLCRTVVCIRYLSAQLRQAWQIGCRTKEAFTSMVHQGYLGQQISAVFWRSMVFALLKYDVWCSMLWNSLVICLFRCPHLLEEGLTVHILVVSPWFFQTIFYDIFFPVTQFRIYVWLCKDSFQGILCKYFSIILCFPSHK